MTRTRSLFLIAFVLLATILLANPFGQFAFNDDFSYSNLAFRWAQTGHLSFNGWNTSPLLVQVPLGGLLIRAFGFSYDALRWLTMAFYIGWAILLYDFFLEYGVSQAFAVFGVLAVTLSPLTIPLAGSFMTDIYGCFMFYASLLAGLYSLKQTESLARGGAWFLFSTIIGIVGGMNRQIVWLAPLVMILAAVVVHRKRPRFLVMVLANAMLLFAAIWATMNWLKSQPSFQYEGLDLRLLFSVHSVINLIRYVLTCFLFSIPILAGVSGTFRQAIKRSRLVAFAAGLTAIVAFGLLYITPHLPMGASGTVPSGEAPWIGNLVTIYGIMVESADLLGHKPVILSHTVRIVFTLLSLFAPILFLLVAFNRSNYLRLRRFAADEAVVARALVLVLSLAGFFSLILERISPFDRYIIQILPFLFVLVVMLWPAPPRPARIGWLALVLFALYGICSTHDYAAARRASVHALQQMEQQGIDRYQVTAGLELNGSDHLRKVDYMRVCTANPPAGGPTCSNDFTGDWKTWWFRKATFSIGGEYALSYSDLPGYQRMDQFTQDFNAWIPPFHRQILCEKRVDLSSTEDSVREPAH